MELDGFPVRITYVTDGKEWFSGSRLITSVDRCGFFLCTSGTAEVTMADDPYEVGVGDVMIYTPSSLVRLISQSSDIQGYLFEVSLDFMLPAVQRVMDVSHILYIRDNPLLHIEGDNAAEFCRQIDELSQLMPVICAEAPELEKIASEIVKSKAYTLLYELLYMYFRHHTVKIGDKGRHNMVLQNFVVHLFSHYRREREVAFYAGLQNMTPRYFSSIIKEQSGRPASMWINNLVISQMRQMLDDPALSVKEVSVRFNFPSQSFFGKYFKLHAGMSPKEYRRSLASGAG